MVVFPFLAFMTADFFPSLEKTQLGPYAGLLGSAFHVSQSLILTSQAVLDVILLAATVLLHVCSIIILPDVAWRLGRLYALGISVRYYTFFVQLPRYR
jgi:uncharacterized membrane protein YGL010W